MGEKSEPSLEQLKQEIRRKGIDAAVRAHRKPPLPSRLLKDLYEGPHETVDLVFLATYPLTPSHLLEELAGQETEESVCSALAGNPRCSQAVLRSLGQHAAAEVRRAVAASSELSGRDVLTLAQDSVWQVRAVLASNPATKAQQQALLARDSEPAVRVALAHNRNLDADVAIALSLDTSPLVRHAVVTEGKADEALLRFWADSDHEEIQSSLLERETLPDAAVRALHLSPFPRVRLRAVRLLEPAPAMLYSLVTSDHMEDRLYAAGHPELPIAAQRLLANDPSGNVRARLASNPGLRERIALHIVASGDRRACLALAWNPHLPLDVLERLCQTEDTEVAVRLTYRDDLGAEHISALLEGPVDRMRVLAHLAIQEKFKVKAYSEELEAELLNDVRASLRCWLARNTQVVATWEACLEDPAARVRQALARNDRLPRSYLEQLREDYDPEVVKVALDVMWREPAHFEEEEAEGDEMADPLTEERWERVRPMADLADPDPIRDAFDEVIVNPTDLPPRRLQDKDKGLLGKLKGFFKD